MCISVPKPHGVTTCAFFKICDQTEQSTSIKRSCFSNNDVASAEAVGIQRLHRNDKLEQQVHQRLVH